ncbi:methyltransferase domain-containing protein [Bombilactobacillus bombi]|uniref:methyltransferase domain-containing protein n=1 Tax=Bombilactobacillus bombi TaxID=1303590 RepID=UPI003B84A8CC
MTKNLEGTNSVIDFVCGTRTLLEIFDKKGWKTAGVNLSKQMLSIAKSKLQSTDLFLSDVTLFKSKDKYDMVVCTADDFKDLFSLAFILKCTLLFINITSNFVVPQKTIDLPKINIIVKNLYNIF